MAAAQTKLQNKKFSLRTSPFALPPPSFPLRHSYFALRHSLVSSVLSFLATAPLGGFRFLGQLEFDHARTDLFLGDSRVFAPLGTNHGLGSCLELARALGGDDDVAKFAVNASKVACQITYLQRFG